MMTSWDDQENIDAYLEGRLSVTLKQEFLKKLKSDPDFEMQLNLQKKALHMIRKYGRAKLKTQLQEIHHQLFSDAKHISFRQKVLSFFSF